MSSEETFGGPSGANNSTIEYAETAVINGVNAKKVFVVQSSGEISILDSLVETLQELSQRLAPLAGAMNSGYPALRSHVINSVTVTGALTSVQSSAEKGVGGAMWGMRVAQENLTAIQSNINNCVGV